MRYSARYSIAVSMLGLSALLLHPQASASEGKVSEAAPLALDKSRASSYASGHAEEDALSSMAPEHGAKAGKAHGAQTNTGKPTEQATRSAPLSTHAADFYIYDAGSQLITDRDGDAYHSEFRIRFDADATFGDALVYARLYLRRVGDSDWTLYHTTDDFWIFGQAPDDDYYVTTTLGDGFPTGEYDIAVDLYESGYDGVVATIGPQDSSALGYLPLEEAGLDVPIEIPGYDIHEVTTTLLIDSDQDGRYSRFRVAFDPDADFDGSFVYAVVWVRPQGGEWIEEFVSDDFPVDASGSSDAYSFTADWRSGYPTAYYDVQIDLHDSATDLLVASAGGERPELSRIPLEDQSRDRFDNPPAAGGGGSATSREHGGGALSLWWAPALLFLAKRRRTPPTRGRALRI